MDSESRIYGQSVSKPRSESKVLVGQKRGVMDVDELSENSPKRVKLRDIQSVFFSEIQAGRGGNSTAHPYDNTDSKSLDLNVEVISADVTVGDKDKIEHDHGHTKSRGFDLDLNAEDVSSSMNDPFYPYKNYENLKSRDDIYECGSSVGGNDVKDSMGVWKGLKQNNYMSTLHGNLPMPIPKPRGRKKSSSNNNNNNNNNDVTKKRNELSKKEQVDRFARVAAPSGLLHGLNPGIINHVRNGSQVRAIIDAIVKSQNDENQISANKQVRQEMGGVYSSVVDKSRLSNGDILRGKGKTEVTRRDSDLYPREEGFSRMPSHYRVDNVNDGLALKLSSLTNASENVSCLSNEESTNLNSVNSLSVKAANVASQWLDLLNQDIKGRLAALRRSKKRVQGVITTDLPVLVSREFSSHTDKASVDAHSNKWSTLFGQMDKALSEEESHLEKWLNQVREMQSHCEKGIYRNSFSYPSQFIGPTENNSRMGEEVDNSENDLAVRAAAASIYSTCNFLLSMENQPCC